MPRVFVYARVSTAGQIVENQLGEVRTAGFDIQPRRIVTETISGGTPPNSALPSANCSTAWNPMTCSLSPSSIALGGMPWMSGQPLIGLLHSASGFTVSPSVVLT